MYRLITLFAAVALLAGTAHADDDVKTHEQTLKRKEYGSLWDKIDACKALKSIDTKAAVMALRNGLIDSEMPAAREQAVKALSEIDDAKETMYALIRDRDPRVRSGLLWAIRWGKHDAEGAKEAVKRGLADSKTEVRSQAARAAGALKLAELGPLLMKRIGRESDEDVARSIYQAIADLELKDAVPSLKKAATGGKPVPQAEALQALARLDKDVFKEVLPKALKDSKAEVRMGVAYALQHIPADDAIEAAIQLIGDRDWRVRTTAIDTMVALHDKRGVQAMIDQFAKEKARLKFDFAVGLGAITGKELGYEAEAWKAWWASAGASFELPEKGKHDGRPKLDGAAGGGGDGSVAMFFGMPIYSAAVVFAIDFSGSMNNDITTGKYKGKTKLKAAFDQLEEALGRFGKDQRFTGCNVSTEAKATKKRFLTKMLVPANNKYKYLVLQELNAVRKKLAQTKRGRGDFFDGMTESVEQIKNTDTLILITDGKPTDGDFVERDSFIPEWQRYNKYRRIHVHAILVGKWDGGFMDELSKGSGGLFIHPTDSRKKK